jgi:hypothetical protein
MPSVRKDCFGFRRFIITLVVAFIASSSAFSQEQPFNKGEFAARRAKLFEKISDGVGIVFAAKGQVYPVKFRQSPDFYYLTGIEEEDAVLVLVGSKRQTFIFAPKLPDSRVSVEGPGIWQEDNPMETYGLSALLPLESFL